MPKLRIVSVNDVYSLEHLPRLKTLVDRHRSETLNETLIVVLAGDFLAPSLLSSIDAGRGMVDCLNDVGLTHVILGNHEDDLPANELEKRLGELHAKCLGTNIRSAALGLPRFDVIDVSGLSVGLVGVVMADASVYRGRPFGGVELLPANEAVLAEAKELFAKGVRAVVPITHQSIADDRLLAEARASGHRFPVIVGGHEHTPMLVELDGTWIVKAGAEAVRAVITDIVWSADAAEPAVTVRYDEVSGYAEDPELRRTVDKHMATVRELASATLYYTRPGERLSSKGTRSRQTTVGTLICSRLRDCLGAEAGLFNGGGIRASQDYLDRFTYGDVEAEVPFDNEVVVALLPGSLLREAVAVSRAKAPAESGAFLQVDDRTIVDAQNVVVEVAGAPLDLGRLYRVAIVRELLLGLDHVEPFVRWSKENPALVPPSGSGREPKMVLVQSFALEIWRELGGFDAMDADGDDRVTPSEIAANIALRHPSQAPSTILADIIVRAVDVDADRVISRSDAAALARLESEMHERLPPKAED
jgi:2',3'-cyclic-nucleotide 2'-phosphodiesterase (5'-nucleotidase family)